MFVAPAGFGKSTAARLFARRRGTSAIADMATVDAAVDVVRVVVVAVINTFDEPERGRFTEQSVAFGTQLDGWMDFAGALLPLFHDGVLVVENAESIGGRAERERVLERLVRFLRSDVALVICSRTDVNVRFDRTPKSSGGPMTVGPDDLRFDRAEIARIFEPLGTSANELDAIERYTQGWPIIVMMLFALARRGRLAGHLSGESDHADLYGYLASEVVEILDDAQRAMLEALSAIPDVSSEELALLFPENADALLTRLERDTPFVSRRSDGTADVHPALRQMLAAQADLDVWRQQLFTSVDRGDGGIRAAEIALLRGRPNDAAEALIDLARPYPFIVLGTRLNGVLSRLPRETLIAYPVLWSATAYSRTSYDTVTALMEGEEIASRFDRSTPIPVMLGTLSNLAQLFINRGHFPDAQRVAERLRSDPLLEGVAIADVMGEFWDYAGRGYRGERIDLSELDDRFAEVMASPSTAACVEAIVVAADHRLRGDTAAEAAALARAHALAATTEIPIVIAICFVHAAFGAWFHGDDEAFRSYVRQIVASFPSGTLNVFSHFVNAANECLTGSEYSSEPLNIRNYAFLIAAGLAKTRNARRRYLDDALVAAERSGQRFSLILSHVARALDGFDERSEALARARALAVETQSHPMIDAVEAIIAGRGDAGMLTAFVARFDRRAERQPRASAIIVRAEGATTIVNIGENAIKLSGREGAVLLYLLESAGSVQASRICADLWPAVDRERARAILKVVISRLRKRLGVADIILNESGGYRLGLALRVTRA